MAAIRSRQRDQAVRQIKETLVIIPARGGSKGLPKKNILPLGGKPLIAHTIEDALNSRLITRVVVSTEDQQIADIARSYGAEVPFLRPLELADDHSDLHHAVCYTQDRLMAEGYAPWSIVYMYATSPFRPPGFTDFLVSKLYEGFKTAHTVRDVSLRGPFYRFHQGQGRPQALQLHGAGCPQCYRHYGSLSCHRQTPGHKGHYVHYMRSEAMCIDIDTPEDFHLAELTWQRLYGQRQEP